MKNSNRILLSFLAMFISGNASASIIYNFDVSDVSWSTSIVSGAFNNVKFSFEFTDTADLNALNNSDLLSIGVITPTYSEFANSSIQGLNINEIFGISNGVASLTVGKGTNAAVWESSGLTTFSMQVGQGNSSSLTYRLSNGETGLANSQLASHTYFATAVPVPAAFWLLASAILGLARFRKTVV